MFKLTRKVLFSLNVGFLILDCLILFKSVISPILLWLWYVGLRNTYNYFRKVIFRTITYLNIRQYVIKVRIITYWAKLLLEDDCKLKYVMYWFIFPFRWYILSYFDHFFTASVFLSICTCMFYILILLSRTTKPISKNHLAR